MSRVIFIDADYLIYRHGFAAQETVSLPDGSVEQVLKEDIEDVLDSVQQALDAIIYDTRADQWHLFIGGKGNYREDVATIQPYKGNRDSSNKPIAYDAIRDYLKESCDAIEVSGEEADDAVSYRHMEIFNRKEGIESCIVSMDKDLMNTPGLHYNPVKKEFTFVSAVEASRNFHKQLLSGDTSDNIPGLYKITGLKATKKIKNEIDGLDTSAEMYAYVHNTYKSALEQNDKDTDNLADILLEIGRLLWIRREPNELWKPCDELC